MKPEEIIKKFKEETGYTLEYNDGVYSYGGSLSLRGIPIQSLPDNLTVGGGLDLGGTQIQSLPDNLTVGGRLYLGRTPIQSLPDNLTVGGSLDLAGTPIQSLPDNLTVGGCLYLVGTPIQSLPDNLTVGGSLNLVGTPIRALPDNLTVGDYLDLVGTPIQSLPDNLTVGGDLDLGDTQIQSLPDNLTVGGSLNLVGIPIQSLPDNLTVGGDLYLGGTQIQSLPDNLTVGGDLYLKGTPITDTSMVNRKFTVNMVDKLWSNSKFIKVDGMFAEKVSHHGNVWEVKKINGAKTFFIVTDGNGKYAHGDTIQEVKKDLIYKISNRDKSEYENLNLRSELTFEEAIECYRVITGACSFGTKDFVENYLSEKKERYTVQEMIDLTRGRYGNETFKEFFKL